MQEIGAKSRLGKRWNRPFELWPTKGCQKCSPFRQPGQQRAKCSRLKQVNTPARRQETGGSRTKPNRSCSCHPSISKGSLHFPVLHDPPHPHLSFDGLTGLHSRRKWWIQESSKTEVLSEGLSTRRTKYLLQLYNFHCWCQREKSPCTQLHLCGAPLRGIHQGSSWR